MKNVFKTSGILLLFLFVSCFTACEKEAQEEIKINGSSGNISLAKSSDGCNDHDYYGEIHNQGLEYIMGFQTEFLALADDEVAMRTLVAEKTEEFLHTVELEGLSNEEISNIDWASFYEANLTDQESIIESTEFTDYEKQILATYLNQLSQFDVVEPAGLAEFIDFTENFECTLLGDEEIINHEGILAGLSVAKHSAQYWTSFEDFSGEQTFFIIPIIASDVFGAFLGLFRRKNGKKGRVVGYAVAFSATMGLSELMN